MQSQKVLKNKITDTEETTVKQQKIIVKFSMDNC